MKNNKTKRIVLILCTIVLFLSACTTSNPLANVIQTDISADTSQETETVSEIIDFKYEKIRFGETQDILLLDIEWHTPKSFKEAILEEYGDIDGINDGILKWIDDTKENINSKETYIAKTINGKSYSILYYFTRSSNPYNNRTKGDPLAALQIDPNGYYIFNIYPFYWAVGYIDENGEYQYKDYKAANEREFCLIADDIISYCDELLAERQITQEEYNQQAIKSPLDYYVRVLGWFGEEDLKNYPLQEYKFSFLPTPELIKDIKDFTVLFIGNSLTYSGNMPKQIKNLSEMYGITIEHDSITPPGAILNDTKEQAIKKIQENQYDYVIFHDGGSFPVSDHAEFLSNIELLCEEARKSGAIPVLFNPAWANIDKKPAKDYQAQLTAAYEKATKIHGAILVNAGEAWVYAYDKHPDLKLYADDVHANNAGAYLTACVFVSTLFDLHIKDICENNTYHGDDALRLGQAAWEYVQYYNEYKKFPTEIVTVPDGINVKIVK